MRYRFQKMSGAQMNGTMEELFLHNGLAESWILWHDHEVGKEIRYLPFQLPINNTRELFDDLEGVIITPLLRLGLGVRCRHLESGSTGLNQGNRGSPFILQGFSCLIRQIP